MRRALVYVLVACLAFASTAYAQQWVLVNGIARIAGGFVMIPGAQPGSTTTGHLYFDSTSNVLRFYNGTTWGNVGGTYTTSAALASDITDETGSGALVFQTSPTLAGGTVTTSNPALTVTQTWNAAGVSFIGTTLAYTETASAAGSRYLQILGGAGGATDEFVVLKGGLVGVGRSPVDTNSYGGGILDVASAIYTRLASDSTKEMDLGMNTATTGLLAVRNTAASTDFLIYTSASGTTTKSLTVSNGGAVWLGNVSLTLTAGALGLPKITASGSAPGAAGAKLELVCGTNAGTAKLVIAAGTSATVVTIVDNIGAGVTGC